tara:strand:+ start:306 stop:440 length:135 start_codon:yes stop_codon:yes gene_type:complete
LPKEKISLNVKEFQLVIWIQAFFQGKKELRKLLKKKEQRRLRQS